MRLLEWGLIFLSLLAIVAPKPKQSSRIQLWIGAILAMLLAHFLVDGARWQMVPLYLVLAVAMAAPFLSLRLSRFIKRVDRSVAILLSLTSLLLGNLFPVVQFEPLAGTHDVGTIAYDIGDEVRNDPFTYAGELPRQLRMQVWYPAHVTTESLAVYSDDIHLGGMRWMSHMGLPPFLASHVPLINARAYTEPPVLGDEAPYPVLMFVGGLGGQRTQNSLLFEQLASEGYIVVAADHPFYSGYTLYPNNEMVATYRPDMFNQASPEGNERLANMVDVLVGDIDLILNTLNDLSAKPYSRFTDRINIEQIGLFGHSTGAAAAAQFCQIDLRCKAYLGLDPWLMPSSDELVTKGLPQPVMIIRGEDAITDSNKPRLLRLAHNSHDRHYQAILHNAQHLDFTDYRHFSPLLRWGGLVSGRAERHAEIVQAYTQAFFDHELRGWGGALLFINSAEFPEAAITTHH
ncbi:MAG: alpha/beta hydrolase family protein [Candidatus Promineifilaceae bacterium]